MSYSVGDIVRIVGSRSQTSRLFADSMKGFLGKVGEIVSVEKNWSEEFEYRIKEFTNFDIMVNGDGYYVFLDQDIDGLEFEDPDQTLEQSEISLSDLLSP